MSVLHEGDPEPVAEDVVRDVRDRAVGVGRAPLAEELVCGLDRVEEDHVSGAQLDADHLPVLVGPFQNLQICMGQ